MDPIFGILSIVRPLVAAAAVALQTFWPVWKKMKVHDVYDGGDGEVFMTDDPLYAMDNNEGDVEAQYDDQDNNQHDESELKPELDKNSEVKAWL